METPVKALMTGSPRTIEPEASALVALDLMIDHGIRHLPVVDATQRVVGVVSIDDLRAALPVAVSLTQPLGPRDREASKDLSVGEIMTWSPVVVGPEVPLEEAAACMAERRIGCLPVVDTEQQLHGILTETDVLHALATVLWTDRLRRGEAPRPDLAGALREEHDKLLEKLARHRRHEREITETRRETPLDRAEDGADAADESFTEALAAAASRRLQALEHALERAERGELERCERCGADIPEARLRALPGATTCIACARADDAAR